MTQQPPLLRRYPGLADIPRAAFGTFPTPVESVALPRGTLMIKRDDLSGSAVGGNKVRGLEWLLGDLRPNQRVLTVGPRGSTHGLATALCARQMGAHATVVRWNQRMNDAARRVDARLARTATVFDAIWVSAAYSVAGSLRMLPRVRWIGAGGASPLALLGHANAALELVEQVARRECELPATVFVPLGTGGTAAGLALGFRIAGVSTRVVAVRVVPKSIGRINRILRLARGAARFIERRTGAPIPPVTALDVSIEHAFYGGTYGKPLREPPDERPLQFTGIRLDDTYSRKTFAAALAHVAGGGERALFWLTFDGRLLS
jgi:1-aminocyclopropane-1-carboxylate deaminase/D-cysteine desulfhydrase-like pyridoxal-dependent ACC family enzyme